MSFALKRAHEGKLTGLVNIFVERSDRRAEVASRDTEELLRAILNSPAVGVAVLTTEGRFVQVNEAFCMMTGYVETELHGIEWMALAHTPDSGTMREQIDQLLAGEVPTIVLEQR